jgi:hypothetical protein
LSNDIFLRLLLLFLSLMSSSSASAGLGGAAAVSAVTGVATAVDEVEQALTRLLRGREFEELLRERSGDPAARASIYALLAQCAGSAYTAHVRSTDKEVESFQDVTVMMVCSNSDHAESIYLQVFNTGRNGLENYLKKLMLSRMVLLNQSLNRTIKER